MPILDSFYNTLSPGHLSLNLFPKKEDRAWLPKTPFQYSIFNISDHTRDAYPGEKEDKYAIMLFNEDRGW
jgi:hypothetical protein